MNHENKKQFDSIAPPIINSEASALLLSGMSIHGPYRELTRRGFDEMLEEMQGDEPGWLPREDKSFEYCETYFEPADLVDPYTFKRGSVAVKAYELSSLGNGLGVSIAGAALAWSLYCSQHHPELSLRSVLGRASFPHTLIERLDWIRALVGAGSDGMECADLVAHITDSRARGRAVKRLSKDSFSKFVKIEKQPNEKPVKKQPNNPLLLLTGEERQHGRDFAKLSPERQAVYNGIAKLVAAAKDPVKIPLDDFIQEVAAKEKDIDVQKLRGLVVTGINPNQSGLTGLRRLEPPQTPPPKKRILEESSEGKVTLKKGVWLKPEYQEPFSKLVTNLDSSTTRGLDHFKTRAWRIAGNAKLCAHLMAKARRDSPNYTPQ